MTYSLDIKASVLKYHHIHKNLISYTTNNISLIFMVSIRTFYYWLKNEFINVSQRKFIKKSIITDDIKNYIIYHFIKENISNVKKLRKKIKKIFDVSISRSSIYNLLKRENYTFKKISYNKYPHTDETLKTKKLELNNNLNSFAENNIISIDETSVDINIKTNYGWAKKGSLCVRKISPKRSRVSVVVAIDRNNIINYKIVAGTINGEIYKNFIDETIKDTHNKKLLMDNARIHHYKLLKTFIKTTDNDIIYNIPYHPQSNPVEFMFSKFKFELKKYVYSNINDLKKQIHKALNLIEPQMLNNYFNKSANTLKL